MAAAAAVAPPQSWRIAAGFCLGLAMTSGAAAQAPSAGAGTPSVGTRVPEATGFPRPDEPKRVKTITIRPDRPEPERSKPVVHWPQSDPNAEPRRIKTLPVRPADEGSAREKSARPQSGAQTGSGSAAQPGTYMVQVSAQRSEGEAEAAYRALQAKYPSALGGREMIMRRVDLGGSGIFYRAQVGPFASSTQAKEFCDSLKAAGGQCIVQRN